MFRKIFKVLCLFQVLLIFGSDGCRSGKTQNKQIAAEVKNENANQNSAKVSLEDYFFQCMQKFEYKGEPDIQTIVDFTIRHSTWFSKTKIQYCALSAVDCWQYLVGEYIRTDSQYLKPAKRCIEQYGRDAGLPGKISSVQFMTNPPKEAASKLNISLEKFEERIKKLWSPEDPGDQSFQNLSTLLSFMHEDVVCGLDFCDCAGLVLPPGERCGDNWYSRMPAITRNGSDLKNLLLKSSNLAIEEAQRSSCRVPIPTPRQRLSSNLTHQPPIRLPKQVFVAASPPLNELPDTDDIPTNQPIFEGPAPTFRTPADVKRPPQLTYLKLLQIFLALRSTAPQTQNSTNESSNNG